MVDEQQALKAEIKALKRERTAWRVTAENAEPDAARYRWLTFDHPKQDTRVALYAITSSLPFRGKGNTDAAIDAAMKGES